MSSYRITLLAGDGIGPEITAVARQLLEVVAQQHNFSLSFDPQPVGGAAIDATGEPLPASTLSACRGADAITGQQSDAIAAHQRLNVQALNLLSGFLLAQAPHGAGHFRQLVEGG